MTLIIVAATLYRRPELLYQPRFFAEEGANFFSYAYNSSFFDNLLHSQFGYYTLYNALVTSLAAKSPLESAPLVTTYAALMMQLIASGYVIWCDLSLLNTNLKRFIVASSLPLLSPGQIWLTTIGVQYWLCVITALVLMEKPVANLKSTHFCKAALLLLTGLTGILSCLMTPLFIYKWLKCGARQMLLYSATLCLCSVTQLMIFVQAYLKADGALSLRFVKRFLPFTIYDALASFFYSYLLSSYSLGLLMETKFRLLLDGILFKICSQDVLRECESIYFTVGLLSAIIILPLALKSINNADAKLLMIAVMIIYPLSIVLSVGSVGGPRYVFAPSVILFTVVVARFDSPSINVFYRLLLVVFIALSLAVHYMDFRTLSMFKAYQNGWPKWKDEVAVWRSNPDYPLKIWPPPWAMQLNPREP